MLARMDALERRAEQSWTSHPVVLLDDKTEKKSLREAIAEHRRQSQGLFKKISNMFNTIYQNFKMSPTSASYE